MECRVIGLVGDIGSGKDSAARFIQAAGAANRAFAAALRNELMLVYPDQHAIKLLTTNNRDEKETPSLLLAASHVDYTAFPDFRDIVAAQAEKKYGLGSWLTGKQVPVSPRDVLRWYGTEYRRELFDSDYWVHRLEEWAERQGLGPDDVLVVPDVRMQNEVDWVRQHGWLVKVLRTDNPHAANMSTHKSDQLQAEQVDYVLYNYGSLLDLGVASLEMCQELGVLQ